MAGGSEWKGENMSDAKIGGCRTCEANAKDRPSWGPGPWFSEPDRAEWRHAGLPCIAHRGGSGAWCGYVGVSPGHPAHGKDFDDVGAEAHGGLTYARACAGHVCHVPEPGESDDLFWLGFDCAHSGDAMPGFRDAGYGHYWTLEEVRAETCRLAEQLAEMGKKS